MFLELGLTIESVKLSGGGSRSTLWRQIISDVLGRESTLTLAGDASLGAAMMGGIAMGTFKDVYDAVRRCVKATGSLRPDSNNKNKYDMLFHVYKDVHNQLISSYKLLDQVTAVL